MKNLSAFRILLGSLALAWGTLLAAAAQTEPAATLLRDAPAVPSTLAAALTRARPLALDVAAARAVLAAAPPENQLTAAPLVLSLPLPDGRNARFAVREIALMAPALAAQFPDIRTYVGAGLDEPTATVRLDLTPAGFHAMLLTAAGTVFIDPARLGDTAHYISYFEYDRKRAAAGTGCTVPAEKGAVGAGQRQAGPGSGAAAVGSGGVRRTFRLAVAATGEYTAMHGGTVALAQAAIVTTMNRVGALLERTIAVRLVLVAGNSQLIYLNPNTDPYTNGDSNLTLGENQATLDAVIGAANYDMGHVFGTGGGGRAQLRSVCQTGAKARGYSGASPRDSFDIRIVAHEMGHQFGAQHTFNSSSGSCNGNRNGATAWEPGAGVTIMSYSANCIPDNLQSFTEPIYHVGSFEEMRDFVVTTTCAAVVNTGNTPPVVSPPPGGLTLPMNTPFRLTANAVDADNDPLTYSWEELDRGQSAGLFDSQLPNDNVPLFRSLLSVASPTRYFPRLADLVNNTTVLGERLPTVARALTFKCTVRDVHSGPAGLSYGGTSSDSLKLRVTSAAGPFIVSSPNTALTWAGGSTQTVTWNVAGTTANGVNCALVNVRLSTDGGYTYPTLLARSVPNSGSAAIAVPNVNTTQARIMVEAADNYFFDISNANFAISSPSPCAPPTALAVNMIMNASAVVSFTAGAGATQFVVTTTPATTTQTVSAAPLTLTGLAPGTAYTVQVASICGGTSTSVAATASFVTTAPVVCSPPIELALSNRTTTTATVSFVPVAAAVSYTVTTVPATTTQTVTTSPITLSGLLPGTRYTVRVVSNCAAGATSAAATLALRTIALPPANDLCGNALPLICGVRTLGYTESSTATGDPTLFCTESVDGEGVFYTLANTSGAITITTCDPETDFDTKLHVYEGPCGGPYVCIVGNDDTPNCGQPSTVNFTAVTGHTYLVFVSGYAGETGYFGMLATCAVPNATARASAAAFQVWPNPAGAAAAFRITLPAPATAATATLRNVLGQEVARRTFSGSSTELATAGLASGTYLLTVQVAGQVPAVRRVVVE